jgi:two-component system NtrC family sensor kinase
MPGSLFQVFCNIIKNALDAMPAGGLLRVQMRANGRHCVLEFNDTGCGIDPEDAERIFEPFYTTKRDQGAGLGLAVCRSILQRLGGTISAAPRSGGGTVITVRIPLARARPAAKRRGARRPPNLSVPDERPPAGRDEEQE